MPAGGTEEPRGGFHKKEVARPLGQIGEGSRVAQAQKRSGCMLVGPCRPSLVIDGSQVEFDVGHGGDEDPEVAVDRCAVEDFDHQLDIRLVEKPITARVGGDLCGLPGTDSPVGSLPVDLDLEASALQAEGGGSGATALFFSELENPSTGGTGE